MSEVKDSDKTWFQINAKAGPKDSAEIYLYNEIGFFGVTAGDFRAQLSELSDDVKNITLLIDSDGGDVFAGWAMINALKEHPARVTARVMGLAASMASVVAVNADELEVYENSFLMIHNPWTYVVGDAEEMERSAQNLRVIQSKIVKAYVTKTGMSEEKIKSMMAVESLIPAEDAVELGFADKLLPELKAVALKGKFKDLPTINEFQAGFKGWDKPDEGALIPPSTQNQTEEQSEQKPTTPMSEPTKPEDAPKALSPRELYAQDKPRRDEIKAIGERFRVSEDKVNAAIEGGTEIENFRNSVMDNFDPNTFTVSEVKPQNLKGSDQVGDKAAENFSMFKAVRELSEGGSFTGLEKEVQDELSKKYHAATGEAPDGLLIPAEWWNNSKRKIQNVATVGTGTTGGNTVETEMQGLTDYLSDYSILPEIGATIFRDANGNLEFPRSTAGFSGTWDAETDTIAASDPTFAANLTLTPKRVGALSKVSRKLLLQSSVDFEAWIRNQLQKAISEAVDRAAITGTGSSDQPTGILAASGTGSYTWISGNAAWVNIVDQVAVLRGANGNLKNATWLTDHTVRADWKKTPVVSGASNMIIERGFKPREAMVDDLPFYDHTDVTTGKVVLGDWTDLLVALWGGIQLTYDPYSSKASGQVELYAETFADVGVLQPASFVIGDNGKTHNGSIS